MKREDYEKAKDIVSVLDRIDRVLSTTVIIHDNKTSVKHSFKEAINTADLCLLIQHDVKNGFLDLLYKRKLELEEKLKNL